MKFMDRLSSNDLVPWRVGYMSHLSSKLLKGGYIGDDKIWALRIRV